MKYQIFAFSHAGGTVNFYKELESYLSDNIIFTPIEYPGHGLRMSEPLIHDIYGLLEDITNKIFENKQDIPFALMGYSLGSSICYYLYFKLLKEYNISPKNIFFMANTPPYSDDDEKIANLDDDKFLAKLEEYGGIPKEFLAYPDLVQFYLPILRTDVALSESCNAQIDKINSDMTII